MDFDQCHPDGVFGLERTIMTQDLLRDDANDTSDARANDDDADADLGTGAAADGPKWEKQAPKGAAGRAVGYEGAAGGHNTHKRQGLGKGAEQMDDAAVAVMAAHGRLPNGLTAFRDTGVTSNTGVKGVKADYEEACQITKHNRIVGEIQKRAIIDNITTGTTMEGPSWSLSAAGSGGGLVQGRQNAVDGTVETSKPYFMSETLFSNKSGGGGGGGGGGADDSDSGDDDAFLAKYRQLRMQQMKQAAALPTFGQVTECTPEEFVDAVDNADKRVFVVIHLSEERNVLSRRMSEHLAAIAPQKPHVRFLQVQNAKCPTPVHETALPAFLCYKGGELVKSVVAAYKSIGNDFSADEVLWLLNQQLDVKGVAAS
jgi:hypothetical protein